MQAEWELLERVAAAGGRLLRVERGAAEGNGDAARVSLLLCTFDVGLLLIAPDPGRGALRVSHVETREQAPPGLVPADEDEPWWRVLGSPLHRVRSRAGPGTPELCLQFRSDEDDPRLVAVALDGARLRVALEHAGGG